MSQTQLESHSPMAEMCHLVVSLAFLALNSFVKIRSLRSSLYQCLDLLGIIQIHQELVNRVKIDCPKFVLVSSKYLSSGNIG
jgi:hypothetical protein